MSEKFDEILKGVYDYLTEEQKEKAKACKTMDEFLKFASEEGIELPDETLDSVAGGVLPIDPKTGKHLTAGKC